MIHTKRKAATALCLLVAAVATCSLSLVWMPHVDAAPVPKHIIDRGLIWLFEHDAKRLITYSPGGAIVHQLDLPEEQEFLGITPDGSKILYAAKSGDKQTYHLRDLGHNTEGLDLGLDYSKYDLHPFWNRDGTKFIRQRGQKLIGVHESVITYDIFNIKTKSLTRIEQSHNYWIFGWTPDEKKFVSMSVSSHDERNGTLFLMTGMGELVPLEQIGDQVDPHEIASAADGRTLLVGGIKRTPKSEPWYQGLWKIDIVTGQVTELVHEKGHGYTQARWSLDCSELCMLWCYAKDPDSGNGWDEVRLTIAKADGSNRKTITLRDKSKGEKTSGLSLFGWYPSNHKIRAAK